jgi:hypothetical protein
VIQDLRELIGAAGDDSGEKVRREKLLSHLQATNEAEPLELAKYSLEPTRALALDMETPARVWK